MSFFTEDEGRQIANAIAAQEARSTGEIRVCVARRCWGSVLKRAVREFRRLKMDRTRDRAGVLILIAPTRRRFEIIGDAGINERVVVEFWSRLAATMTRHFHDGTHVAGVLEVIERVGTVLADHFPRRADDTNELPNEVVES